MFYNFKSHKKIYSLFIFILSLVLILFFLKKVDYNKFQFLLKNLNNNIFISSYIICLIQTVLNIKKFSLLFRKKINEHKLLKIFFISSFLNFILPFKLGEIKKIYLLKKFFRINYSKNIEIIIVDKFFEISVYIFFSVFIVFFLHQIKLTYILATILFILLYFLFLKNIQNLCNLIKIKLFYKLEKIFLNYTKNNKNFYIILFINIIFILLTFIHFNIFIKYLVIGNFSFFKIISFVSLISLIGFIPFTYNGIGFREFFILLIFSQLLTPEEIILISIFFISRGIPSAIVGAFFYLVYLIKNNN